MTRTIKKQLPEARSEERQQRIAYLYACGSRVVMEAMLEVSDGKSLDEVLTRYCEIPVSTYRIIGADVLPIHAEFEVAWRRFTR